MDRFTLEKAHHALVEVLERVDLESSERVILEDALRVCDPDARERVGDALERS